MPRRALRDVRLDKAAFAYARGSVAVSKKA